MIRIATETDIDEIFKITKLCANAMKNNGIYQWNDHYPNVEAFKKDVMRNELYVIENESEVIGCITISNVMDDEYKAVEWLTLSHKNIYIHRLAIHPKYQSQGYAQKLMSFAEGFAMANNYTSIRLDTFSQNKRNQKFYEKRGYVRLGDIYFPKQSEFPFHCYEKVF